MNKMAKYRALVQYYGEVELEIEAENSLEAREVACLEAAKNRPDTIEAEGFHIVWTANMENEM
jgi:hypothetical protein